MHKLFHVSFDYLFEELGTTKLQSTLYTHFFYLYAASRPFHIFEWILFSGHAYDLQFLKLNIISYQTGMEKAMTNDKNRTSRKWEIDKWEMK